MKLLNSTSRGARLARTLLRAPIAVAGVGAFFAASSLTAAQPKDVTIDDQPVQVEVVNNVPVVVEVVNDALKTPYYLELRHDFERGFLGTASDVASVPVGKRFVVESVSAYARTPSGYSPSVELHLLEAVGAPDDAQTGIVDLLLQPQGTFNVGGTDIAFWVGTYSLKLLVDSNRNALRAECYLGVSTDQGFFKVNLAGYLEDL